MRARQCAQCAAYCVARAQVACACRVSAAAGARQVAARAGGGAAGAQVRALQVRIA